MNKKNKIFLTALSSLFFLCFMAIYISASDTFVFTTDAPLQFFALKETEIITNSAGDTLYLNSKYYSEGNFFRTEMIAFKEGKQTFYIQTPEFYYIWWISAQSTGSAKKSGDINEIERYKNSILKYSAEIISDYYNEDLKKMDEIKFEVMPITNENIDGTQAYHFTFKTSNSYNINIRRAWITPQRRLLKEVVSQYKSSGYSNPDNLQIQSTTVKKYEYDCVLPEELCLPPANIIFK